MAILLTERSSRSLLAVPMTAVVCGLALCAFLVRLLGIGHASFWLDEIFSVYYVKVLGFKYVFGAGLNTEPTPPLFATLLYYWMNLFGTSEAGARSLSALISALTLPVVFLIGREVRSDRAGILASILYLISPISLDFAQEARAYALQGLFEAIAVLACLRLLRDMSAWRAAVLYVLGTVAANYTHATSVVAMVSVALCATAYLCFQRADGWRARTVRWLGLNLVCVLLTAPYLAHIGKASGASNLDWIPPLSVSSIAGFWTKTIVGLNTPSQILAAGLALVFYGLLFTAVLRNRPDPRALFILIGVPVVFFCLATAESLVRPILLARIFAWVLPLRVMALAVAVSDDLRLGAGLYGLATAVFLIGLVFHYTAPNGGKEPFRQAVDANRAVMGRAAIVAMVASYPLSVAHYDPAIKTISEWPGPDAGYDLLITRAAGLGVVSGDDIRRSLRSGETVVLFVRSAGHEAVARLLAEFPSGRTRAWRCGSVTCLEVTVWDRGRR